MLKLNFNFGVFVNRFVEKGLKGRCKVIFESDTGWIFLATSGNGGLWLASTTLNIQWEARTGMSVTLKNNSIGLLKLRIYWVTILQNLKNFVKIGL